MISIYIRKKGEALYYNIYMNINIAINKSSIYVLNQMALPLSSSRICFLTVGEP